LIDNVIWFSHLFERHSGAVIAAFTIVLALSTIGLWRATRDLYKAAEQQISVARDAADAAKDAAEHVRTVERAYVKLSHKTGLTSEPTGLFFVKMQAKNTGRTPATVTDMRVKPVLLSNADNLSPEPNYERKGSDTHKAFLVANGSAYFGDNFSITPSQLAQVNDGTLKLYLIGYVDYIDAFGERHRGGYARLYDPSQPGPDNNLFFVTEDGYNYDRVRRQGEGSDW
jgi:type II secretory pathway pseudopilin PulG